MEPISEVKKSSSGGILDEECHLGLYHTPGLAFWHLPPSSATIGYAIEGVFLTYMQLSTCAVSTL